MEIIFFNFPTIAIFLHFKAPSLQSEIIKFYAVNFQLFLFMEEILIQTRLLTSIVLMPSAGSFECN